VKAKQAGILAVIFGSTCCIGPLLLVAIGIGSGAVFIGRYHWFFIIAAAAVLAWGWANYLREKTVCDCEHKKMQGRRGTLVTLLITTALVIGLAGLNISRYVFASAPPAVRKPTFEWAQSHRYFNRRTELPGLRNPGAPCAQEN
jgi:hypothetical protein